MKIFAVSDIHGYFDEFKQALDEAGFEDNNPNHLLVTCGDHFDRGMQPLEVMNYLMNLNNVVMIRGNHEEMFEHLCEKRNPQSYDYSNGTMPTIMLLANNIHNADMIYDSALRSTAEFRNKMVNYFETKNYIFVHGWIPCKPLKNNHFYNLAASDFRFNPKWRESTNEQWKQACWCNGIDMAHFGLIEPNKTIVCGHWHCSYGHFISDKTFKVGEFDESAIWDPYYAEGLIAIDRCTAHTGKVNVLVLEDDLLEEIKNERIKDK